MAQLLHTAAQADGMATKIKLMKFLQESAGYDAVTNRRPPPRFGGLYLMELRSHAGEPSASRRKLAVAVVPDDASNTARPVKITRLRAARLGVRKLTPSTAAP